MKIGFLQGETKSKGMILDPRTKLLLVLVISTVLITSGSGGMIDIIRIVLASIPIFLFLMAKEVEKSLKILVVYTLVYLAELLIAPMTSGILGFLLVALSGIFTRFLPGLAMGYYFLSTTTVSEFVASMERMHVTQKIIIPISVMFRFLPTVSEEMTAIRDAMRMRGIGIMKKNPLTTLEYIIVPLLMSAVKIGDELSAASLTRGLGSPNKRTNICVIGFHMQDITLMSIAILSFIGYFAI